MKPAITHRNVKNWVVNTDVSRQQQTVTNVSVDLVTALETILQIAQVLGQQAYLSSH